MSSLLHASYQVPYPYTFLNFMGKTQFLVVDVSKATPGPCIFGPGYTFESKVYAIGCAVFLVYVFSAAVITCSQQGRKIVPWLSTALLLYPSLSAQFFDVLKCIRIDGKHYVIADLSIQCSGSGYSTLWVFAIIWVVLWAGGLPLTTHGLLWPDLKKLQDVQARKQLAGPAQHLKDFCTLYRPAAWFFEVVEFAKKLLLIGIIPAVNGDVVGAVIAMLLVNFYLALLLKLEPFAEPLDNLMAVCLNALFSVVILISVLLKMDAAHLLNQTSGEFDTDAMANLLIVCHVLVIVVFIVAYIWSPSGATKQNALVIYREWET